MQTFTQKSAKLAAEYFMTTAINKNFSANEINILLKLAVPLLITGIVESSVGFFSTLFLAHVGTRELEAGAIVSWIFVTMMVIMWGTLTSISVLVSQKHGEKDQKGVSYVTRDGLLLSVLFVLPASLLLWYMSPILLLIGQNPDTVLLAQEYMHGLVWGVLPDFVGLVLMQFLIGLGHTRSNLAFALLWVPLNIICDYVLIFGKLGFPALGMAGIGWGTSIAYWISSLALAFYLLFDKKYRHYFQSMLHIGPPKFLQDLWHIGLPMGIMYCIEIAFFMTLTLFMGKLGGQVLAANQIVLQYMGVLSVFSFSMAQAITVRMGHVLGEKAFQVAIRAAYIGTCMAAFFMACVVLIYYFSPDFLISLDLDLTDAKNASIIAYTKKYLAICALFQLLEAVRFGLFGALRGLKDTRFTLLSSIITFWFIAFPIGYFLAFHFGFAGEGFWYGIIVGEIFGVVLLYARFKVLARRLLSSSKIKSRILLHTSCIT